MKRRFTAEAVRKAVLTSKDESFSDVDTDREDCNLSQRYLNCGPRAKVWLPVRDKL